MSSAHRNFWCRKADTLNPAVGIPTDVTFIIEDNGGESVQEIKAHKMFLAMASPVFWNQFYGSMKDTKDVIPIRETTKEAFDAMIDFIYEVDINWETKGVVELFYLANMSKRYMIEEMEALVKKILENTPLTMETVVEIADIAEEFCQFDDTSSALFIHCAKFLKSNLKTADSCLMFAAQYSDTDMMATSVKLMETMEQLNQEKLSVVQQPDCYNCGQNPCRNGQSVENYLPTDQLNHIRVKNTQYLDWKGTILRHSTLPYHVMVAWQHGGINQSCSVEYLIFSC